MQLEATVDANERPVLPVAAADASPSLEAGRTTPPSISRASSVARPDFRARVDEWTARVSAGTAPFNRTLVALWILISAALAARLIGGFRALRAARRTWAERVIEGHPVLISRAFGPAVVGSHELRIVIPEWVLALPAADRGLVLEHENHHRTARDPYLLLASALATIAFPWNAALWFFGRRLRLTVEIDCDARVLARSTPPARYAALLVAVAERAFSSDALSIAPALIEGTSNLERRISAMSQTRTRYTSLIAVPLVALAVIPLAAASRAPLPRIPTSPAQQAVVAKRPAVLPTVTLPATVATRKQQEERLSLQNRIEQMTVPAAMLIVAPIPAPTITQSRLDVSLPRQSTPPLETRADQQQQTPLDSIRRSLRDSLPLYGADGVPLAVNYVFNGELLRAARMAAANACLRTSGVESAGVIRPQQAQLLYGSQVEGSLIAVRTRGACSAAQTPPLYVIDGVVVLPDTITDFQAITKGLKIDHIETIRGAAATKLYGPRAEYGVIRITTKKK